MKVIKPVTITESTLISSNVTETEYPAWDSEADYLVGQRVAHQHAIYESVQTPNTGHAPDGNALFWASIRPTNRWLMFDQEVSTQTEATGSIAVMLAPGIVNSLALLELQGLSVEIVITEGDGGPVIYSKSQSLEGSIVTDWYQYFFEPFEPMRELILTDLPPYLSARVSVTIAGGVVKVGSLVLGTSYELGELEHGAQIGIIDYSRKDTSVTGITTFTKRKFSNRMSGRLWIDNGQLGKVKRTLSDLRATPCVWIGVDTPGYETLNIFGFYRDFSIDVAYPTNSYCNLEIEGLT